MNQSLKTVIIIIGVLSILAGLFSYFNQNNVLNSFLGIFIGVALTGSVLVLKNRKDSKNDN